MQGFHFSRRRQWRQGIQTFLRSLHFAYVGRKLRKRQMRSLWIQRIGASSVRLGTSYSQLMGAMGAKGMAINRKMLAEMAATDFEAFQFVHSQAMAQGDEGVEA